MSTFVTSCRFFVASPVRRDGILEDTAHHTIPPREVPNFEGGILCELRSRSSMRSSRFGVGTNGRGVFCVSSDLKSLKILHEKFQVLVWLVVGILCEHRSEVPKFSTRGSRFSLGRKGLFCDGPKQNTLFCVILTSPLY